MAIVGDSLDKYVKEQIIVRQEKLGQYDKDIDLNQYLTSRTAFLRLTSGINVTSESRIAKTLGLANTNDYINNGLAKQFVISSAYFNGEFTSDIGYYSNTSYGFYSDSDAGYVPPPGIISATVKTLNKGSLKEATIELICHNLTQFKIMDTLFLKLRYSLLLEWGHTIFYDNNKTLQTDNIFNLSDDFLKGTSQSDLLNKIETYRNQSSGNYDAFFGVIKNYEWGLMENGSYSITITAISTGDIIESMKINANTTPDQTSEGNSAQYKRSTLHKLLGDVVNINETNGGWAHGYHQSNGEKALNSADLSSFSSIEYSYRKPGDNNTTSGPTSILTNNESTRVFFKDLELDQNNNTVMQQYVKLGTLFRIIEAFTLYYDADRKTTGEPVFKINTNFSTNKCLTIPNQASLDPRICLIPLGFNTTDLKDQVKTKYVETTTKYYFGQSGGTYLFGREESTDANIDDLPSGREALGDRYIVQVDSKYPNENNAVNRVGTVITYATVVSIGASTALRQRLGAPPSTHTDDFVTVTTVSYTESAESEAAKNALATGGTLRYLGNEFRIKGSPSVGRTMHIYANISHVIKTLDNNLDEDGNIALFEFLKNLMSSIQEALGGINDFEVVYRDDENTFYIIDQAYVPSAYHGVEEPRININLLQSDNGSFATRFSLKSELTPAIANAVAMGAQTNGNTLISNSTNFSYLFDGTKDRLLTKKRNVNVDDGSKSFNDSRYSKAYDDYISFITKIVNASNYPLTDADISRHKTSIVDLFNLDVGDYTHKKNIPGTGFIPLNLQLTLDGLSGIKQFQAFKITETLLPDEYINRIKFITKTVTHKIDSKGWFTDISSLSIPKTDKLNDFTNLPNPNITVINTPTDNSGDGGMGVDGNCGGTPRPYTDSNFNILLIPESNNNWRSAQIPEVYLKQFLTDHKIKNVVRLNGHKFQCGDSGYGGAKGTPWDVEEKICKELGINFYKLVPTTDSDQSKIEALLNQGDTWVHCMRGADRTGGAVGGWLHHVKGWTTDRVWDYSVHVKGCHWNTQCFDNVWTSGGYSTQAKKFGVVTTAQAQSLAKKYP